MTSLPLITYCIALGLIDALLVRVSRHWSANLAITVLTSIAGCAVYQALNLLITRAPEPLILVASIAQILLGLAIGVAVVIATHTRR